MLGCCSAHLLLEKETGLFFWKPETWAEETEAEAGEIGPHWGKQIHFRGETGAKQQKEGKY